MRLDRSISRSGLTAKERILSSASELFYLHGIHCVGVDAIARAAGTNKMTLYRHFSSEDHLIVECMRKLAMAFELEATHIAKAYSGNPQGHLMALLNMALNFGIVSGVDRGCPLTNAAVQLPQKNHPAKRLIKKHNRRFRDRLALLCEAAGLLDPQGAADELFLLSQGARLSKNTIGHAIVMNRLPCVFEDVFKRHGLSGK